MSTEPEPLPDGEILMVSDRLILVDHFESAAIAGFLIGREGSELAIHITFAGRLNKSTERADFTVALPPKFAFELASSILDQLELITRPDTEVT